MAIGSFGRAFSKDLLRIEISGPYRPHLTIVDLPGLIHSETKQQSMADVELVQDVVKSYMKEPRSIILAVVSAKNDYANQIVLKLARTADKTGMRTLGVITKPDTLIPGSDSEHMYASLAQNLDVEFRLGWHVLRNMDSETGAWSLSKRDAEERRFFTEGIWSTLPESILGIATLRERLSRLLLSQIAAELPGLIEEIELKSTACRTQLQKLGLPRASIEEKRHYLLTLSQTFQSLSKAATDGTYNNDHLISHISDTSTGGVLFQTLVEPALESIVKDAKRKTEDLLAPHKHRHPITYNHYFTETVQQVKRERNRVELTRLIKDVFGVESLGPSAHKEYTFQDYRPLLNALMERSNPDMNQYACSEALDCMQAYYKTAFKRFVDDVAVEAVKTNLIAKLGDILSLTKVTCLTADVVTSVAGESEQSRSKRKQLKNQLNVLVQGLETCRQFVVGNLHSTSGRQLPRCYILNPETNELSAAGTRDVAIRSARSDSSGFSSPSYGRESDEADENGSQDGVEATPNSIHKVLSASPAPEIEEPLMPDEEVIASDEIVEPVNDDWGLMAVMGKKKKLKKAREALRDA
ncbi:hypothetical protein G6514_004203 [Epicoccum nigrum]|nr:hypothetical protein G6514_004203 [Epicoccum nigrum]